MDYDAEKLLQLIEERPPIYNFKLKEHNHRPVIDKLWEEISEEMSVPVADCKRKWSSLRSSYNRIIRESREDSGSGRKKPRKWNWYLYDNMQFLHEFVGLQRKLRNEDSMSQDSPQELDTNEDTLQLELLCEPELVTQDKSDSERKFSPEFSSLACKIAGSIDKVHDPIMNLSDFSVSRTESREERESATLTFFKSLLPDVEKLSESRKRKFKLSVMSMLYQSLDEQESLE